MSVVNNNLLLTADAGVAPSAYQISRSLRFNSADSAYANRTFGTPTTQGTFTLAMWVKRAALSTAQSLFGVSTNHSFGFTTGNALNLTFGGTSALTTTAVFRDTSAWYHIVWTQSGTSHTVYVNGTSQGTATATSSVFNTAVAHQVGASNTANYFNGYLAEIYFIDGQALTPSSFTETNATTGQLVPKAYTGTYGTNGFRLNFSDNSAATAATLGADSSGNGNNWTPNNLSVNAGGQVSISAASGALPVYNTTDTYGAVKGTGTRTDSNASSLVLAIPMDGANNGTTFTDESATIRGSGTAKAITRSGVTKTLTAQSKYYGSSGFFNGSGDYLSLASSADFAFGTADFAIECWFNSSISITGNSILIDERNTFPLTGQIVVYFSSSAKPILYIEGSGNLIVGTTTITANTWNHIAVSKSSGVYNLRINGISEGTASNSTSVPASGIRIGTDYSGGGPVTGYIQDLRVYKGVAKYTSNFTPPTATQNTTVAVGNDSLTDTPTSYGTDTGAGGEVRGNYCTWNPLDISGNGGTLTNGNLDFSGGGSWKSSAGTIGINSGKYYWEITLLSLGTNDGSFGIAKVLPSGAAAYIGYNSQSWGYSLNSGNKVNNQVQTAYGSALTIGSVLGIAFDCDNGTLTFYKNGISQGTAFTGLTSGIYYPATSSISAVVSSNFGQRPFAYAAPSGFKALCDTNIAEGTITTSGTFTGNANADGPFVYLNGVPTAMTINSNAVTFATHADKLANGFKVRSSSGSYNTAGSNTYSITTTGAKFKYARAQANP
jgi:hypothetical protein